MSGKLGCLMTPPVLGEQEYCRRCSLCSCLLTVAQTFEQCRKMTTVTTLLVVKCNAFLLF